MEDVHVKGAKSKKQGERSEEKTAMQRSGNGDRGMTDWSPMDWMQSIETEMQRIWDAVRPSGAEEWLQPARRIPRAASWFPSTDVLEKDENLVIRMDLPGMQKEDVDLELREDTLIVSGVREHERKREEADYYLVERSSGRFYRRVPLWKGVNADDVDAEFHGGVLEVRVPLPEERQSKTRRITVR